MIQSIHTRVPFSVLLHTIKYIKWTNYWYILEDGARARRGQLSADRPLDDCCGDDDDDAFVRSFVYYSLLLWQHFERSTTTEGSLSLIACLWMGRNGSVPVGFAVSFGQMCGAPFVRCVFLFLWCLDADAHRSSNAVHRLRPPLR